MLVKERQGLEAMRMLAKYYYENTHDPWYKRLEDSIERKLKKKEIENGER